MANRPSHAGIPFAARRFPKSTSLKNDRTVRCQWRAERRIAGRRARSPKCGGGPMGVCLALTWVRTVLLMCRLC